MDGVIQLRMFIIIVLASTIIASYELKCPDRPQRHIRATRICNSTENYSCLLDTEKGTFKESCLFASDFVRPGQKYVFSGLRKNTNCSNGRYQPFKFYSSELSKCAFAKSSCVEEGQIIFNEESTKEDRTCRCDYTRGYTFLSRPIDQCFCNPTESDCSCYIAICPRPGSLSSDNVCNDSSLSGEFCHPIVHTRRKHGIDTPTDRRVIEHSPIRGQKRTLISVKVAVSVTVAMILMFIPIVIVCDSEGNISVKYHLTDDVSNIGSASSEKKSPAGDVSICDRTEFSTPDVVTNIDGAIAEKEPPADVVSNIGSASAEKKSPADDGAYSFTQMSICEGTEFATCSTSDVVSNIGGAIAENEPHADVDSIHESSDFEKASEPHTQIITAKDELPSSQSDAMVSSPIDQIQKLREMYETLEEILQMAEFEKPLQNELSAAYPNDEYLKVISSAKCDLVRNDCGIIVTGETSAGKSTLINQLVGYKMFPTSNVATTATVCRIRDSKNFMLKAYTKDGVKLEEVPFEDKKKMKYGIKKFIDIKHIKEKNEKNKVFYTDVDFPVSILKGNVIIVDTPGIGESEDLDRILLDVLPQAVSFIFVINARNAGGVHDDRLLLIFKAIMKNIEKMPCFDPREILFLTNQWDIVDKDDDDNENGDTDEVDCRTWELIISKLKKEWPLVDEDRIFKISLKQVGKQDGNKKLQNNFKKFEEKLQETITKNQNKRVNFYLSFLQNFVQNAQRGIATRLKLLDDKTENKIEKMNKSLDDMKKLRTCSEKCEQDLKERKNKLFKELADMLTTHLHSSSMKTEILKPKGGNPLKNSGDNQEWFIETRLDAAIGKWLNSPDVKKKIENENEEIKKAVKVIHMKLDDIEMEMTGLKPVRLSDDDVDGKTFLVMFATYMFSKSAVFTVGTVLAYECIKHALFGKRTSKGTIDDQYTNVIKQISNEKIRNILEESFGKQFSNILTRVFQNDIPTKIESMAYMCKLMTLECTILEIKQESYIKLNTKMEELKLKIESMRKHLREP